MGRRLLEGGPASPQEDRRLPGRGCLSLSALHRLGGPTIYLSPDLDHTKLVVGPQRRLPVVDGALGLAGSGRRPTPGSVASQPGRARRRDSGAAVRGLLLA